MNIMYGVLLVSVVFSIISLTYSLDEINLRNSEKDNHIPEEGNKPPHRDTEKLISESVECKDDVKRICGNILMNHEVLFCLNNRQEDQDLTPSCHTLIWNYKVEMSKGKRGSWILKQVCKTELKEELSKCKSEDGEYSFNCLVMSKSKISAQSDCFNFLVRYAAVIFSDYRLLGSYFEACRQDITRFNCGHADDSSASMISSHSQGRVISCMESHLSKVQPQCKAELVKILSAQSQNYVLDRQLYFACQTERHELCQDVQPGEGRLLKCFEKHVHHPKMGSECKKMVINHIKAIVVEPSTDYRLDIQCKPELERFKTCRLDENEELDNSKLAKLLLCIEEQQRQGKPISSKCHREIGNIRTMLQSDYSLTPNIVAYCNDYLEKYCMDENRELPREGKTIHCLMRLVNNHTIQSTERCYDTLSMFVREVNPRETGMDAVMSEACGDVGRKLCSDVMESDGDVLGCLLRNVEHNAMTDDCEELLIEINYFVVRDWSLDSKLYKACRTDAKEKCSDIKRVRNAHYNGEVFACLYRHINAPNKEDRLSTKCSHNVIRVMRERAVAIGLNPQLEFHCRDDLASLCSDKVIKENHEEIECLQNKYDLIQNAECKKGLEAYIEVESYETKINKKLLAHCKPMIDTYCKNENLKEIGEGELFECMIKHKNEPDVHEICVAGIDHFQLVRMKNYKFSPDFREACHDDVTEHCRDSESLEQTVECLSLKIRNAIVDRRSHIISLECRKQIKRELYRTIENIRLSPGLYEACKSDVKEYCSHVKSGNARVLECLKENSDSLTNECKQKLFTREKQEAKDVHMDYKLAKACKFMIKKYCGDEEEEDVFRCLKRHRKDEDFDEHCAEYIFKRLKLKMTDVRLNVKLFRLCRQDVESKCAEKMGLNMNKPQAYHGVMIHCLKELYVKKELSSDECAAEVRQYIHDAQSDYRLDVTLKHHCESEIKDFCLEESQNHPEKVEECLKLAFLEKKIKSDSKCFTEVRRMLAENRADVYADPVLHRACFEELRSYCSDVKSGNGRHIACLLDLAKEKKLKSDCESQVRSRYKMWEYALEVKPVGSVEELYKNIADSPSRSYFFALFLLVIGSIFVGGLVFGRITKRVRAEIKNR